MSFDTETGYHPGLYHPPPLPALAPDIGQSRITGGIGAPTLPPSDPTVRWLYYPDGGGTLYQWDVLSQSWNPQDSLIGGLVAWWAADETRAMDLAVLDKNGGTWPMGTVGNPTSVTGPMGSGNAIAFSGTLQNAHTPTGIGVNWAADWTVSFWVKLTTANPGCIIGRWNFNSAATRSWRLYTTNGTTIRFYSGGSAGTASTIIGTAPSLTNNTWTHIVLAYDSAADRVTIYKNNVGTLLNAAAQIASYDFPLVLAGSDQPADQASSSGNTENCACQLSDVAVWSRLLTVDELTSISDPVTRKTYPGTPYTIPTRDIYIISGQSNADGRGTNNQSYTGGLGSKMLARSGNSGSWVNYSFIALTDPVGGASGTGSCWPAMANAINRQIAVASYAASGTAISVWAKVGVSCQRSGAFGALCYRAVVAGAYGQVKALLWWQGETDMLNGTAEATYNAALDTLANNVQADLGVKLMPCKLQAMTIATYPQANQDAINNAIGTAWGDNANVITGPTLTDLSAITLGDGTHIKTDGGLTTIGGRWATSLAAAGL